MEFNFLIVIICSYVIGSIPSGLVLGKGIWHVDLREHGSKILVLLMLGVL